ncbi:unnamed protein product [Pieris macdunnoughi]|uniref:Uncharacterized protein n=1 Tax=Pieris macdunnoughi TaxID=345717 RepID=A0A821TT48_9NEOP|nr:unnamed protein product [Pieris macdunnoughi]
MAKENKISELLNDPDFFDLIKAKINKDLCNLKKIVDNINQMRVDANQIENNLMSTVGANSWEEIANFIGHKPLQFIAFDIKHEH